MMFRSLLPFTCAIAIASLTTSMSEAQVAPTGGHYAGKPADTGFGGAVSPSGGYQASVAMDLPPARGGLPIPLQVTYVDQAVGAAGKGWDIPLSYIRRDATFARSRPVGAPASAPQPRERATLALNGQVFNLVRTASGWAAQSDGPQWVIREQSDGSWKVYDGNGRTYVFTLLSSNLAGAGLWHLTSILGIGGNKVELRYAVGAPTVPGAFYPFSVNLTGIEYNPSSSGVYKHSISLSYEPSDGNGGTSPTISIFPAVDRIVARNTRLASISIGSKATTTTTQETLRTYHFRYLAGGDPDTKLPRLAKVEMSGRQGVGLLPVSAYTYGTATVNGQLQFQSPKTIPAGFVFQSVGTTVGATPARPTEPVGFSTSRVFADVNGDGLVDFVAPEGMSVNNGNSFSAWKSFNSFAPAPEATTVSSQRYDMGSGKLRSSSTWRKLIDVDGDGRLDIVDASEKSGAWAVHLNTPGLTDSQEIAWVTRYISTAALAAELRQKGLWTGDDYIPLSNRKSLITYVYDVCVLWNGSQWTEYEDEGVAGGCPPGGKRDFSAPKNEITVTQWDFKDINGDGYPDFVFNLKPVYINSKLEDLAPPAHPVKVPWHIKRTDSIARDIANQILVMYNIAGVHLYSTPANPFSSTVIATYGTAAACGIARWAPIDESHQSLACDIVDVNGDGIPDRVDGTSVYLGMGTNGVGAQFSPGVALTLPGALSIQTNAAVLNCTPPISDLQTNNVKQIAGMRDVTGDGIPDYLWTDDSSQWKVAIGTGVGFQSYTSVVGMPADTFISSEVEGCGTGGANTRNGLFDVDGDGRVDLVNIDSNGVLRVSRIVGSSTTVGAPESGHLVKVDNGYGAITDITYKSFKELGHFVPFPEVGVASIKTTGQAGLHGDVSATSYTRGAIDLFFDPAADAFVSQGYEYSSEKIPTASNLNLTIVYKRNRVPREDPYRLRKADGSLGTSTPQQRYSAYLNIGKIVSVYTSSDGHNSKQTDYVWNSRVTSTAADPVGQDICMEMPAPYDATVSTTYNQGNGGYNVCQMRGFSYQLSALSTRNVDSGHVAVKREVLSIDDFGRITKIRQSNDVDIVSDDLCVDSDFASTSVALPRVLSATSISTISNCASVIYARDSWKYDGLAQGQVSEGLLTSHDVERRSDDGALLGTIHEFDASYDTLGNRLVTLSMREDGAIRSNTLEYDVFSLVPTSVTDSATDAATTQSIVTYDPVTLAVTSVLDPNGTQVGATYDTYGRPLLSTVTKPYEQTGATSAMSYVGFEVGASGGRRIEQTLFTDAVPLAQVSTALGRKGVTFLDELGRPIRSELTLGSDYGTTKLVIAHRDYDGLGRVVFEADPYPSTESFSTAYGTTRFFNADGSPSCFVRGAHGQGYTEVTDEAHEIYPTCFKKAIEWGKWTVRVRDASSLLAGSPQAGVETVTYTTAAGLTTERASQRAGVVLQRATFEHDALGRVSKMIRYLDQGQTPKTVSSSWRFDSLGQIVEYTEPEAAATTNTYSNWGELIEVRRALSNRISTVVSSYDGLGRLKHREERSDGVTDAATVRDYSYDQGVIVGPQVSPTNVLGRLARATSPTGDVMFSYDALGNVNARVFTDAQSGLYVEKRAVHTDGSLWSLDLQLPDTGYSKEHVDYTYDSFGRGKSVKYTSGAESLILYQASTVDPFGRARQATYGVTSYSADYADVGRRLLNSVTISSTGGTRAFSVPGYDPMGRERSRSESRDGVVTPSVTSYTYDALGRLGTAARSGGAQTPFNQQFSYDPLGNLLSLTDATNGAGASNTTMTYRDVDRDRICHLGLGTDSNTNCNVSYDEMGNTIGQPTRAGQRQLTFFDDGSVRTISDANSSAQFRYDAFGEVQEVDLTSSTSFDTRHDRRYGDLISWRDVVSGTSTTSVLTRTIPGPDGFAATRQGAGGSWSYSFGEARGNRVVVDETGAFVQDIDYLPYGEPHSTGAMPGSSKYRNEQWNGGDYLAALGVSHLGARIYDPVLGRFLSRDPLLTTGSAQMANPYSFAFGDPINASDPTGLTPCSTPSCLYHRDTGEPPPDTGNPNNGVNPSYNLGQPYGEPFDSGGVWAPTGGSGSSSAPTPVDIERGSVLINAAATAGLMHYATIDEHPGADAVDAAGALVGGGIGAYGGGMATGGAATYYGATAGAFLGAAAVRPLSQAMRGEEATFGDIVLAGMRGATWEMGGLLVGAAVGKVANYYINRSLTDAVRQTTARGTLQLTGAVPPKFNLKMVSRPAGMNLKQFGSLIGWTQGGTLTRNYELTQELIRALPGRIDELRAAGVTRSMAFEWADAYRLEIIENPSNPNAGARMLLMQAIGNLL